MRRMTSRDEAAFIGGRSGVGKSSVGHEIHAQLSAAGVSHCLIEGDNLDMARPVPHEHGHRLAEKNLAAMWANYRALGHGRMIYINTAGVFPSVVDELTAAMGGEPLVTLILLTCDDRTARSRLERREIGSMLDWHADRGEAMARKLDERVPDTVRRVVTDSRVIADIAAEIIGIAGWAAGRDSRRPPSTEG
jgi:2-phosphoglycerate kinase